MTRVGLFVRVYAFGMALLALFLVVASWLVTSQVVPVLNATTRSAARWLAEDLLSDCADVPRLSHRLDRMRALTPYDVSVVCGQDASFGPPATLSPAVLARLRTSGDVTEVDPDVFVEGDSARYVVFRDRSTVALWVGLQWFLVLLLGLAVAAWPVARSVAGPLRRLQAEVARFGAGDLSARVGSARSDEVGELARSFDAMADRIQAQVSAQKLLVAGISHELRTPLHRMSAALALLPAADESPEGEIRAEVLRDVRELSALLEDVFLLARLESGPATFESLVKRTPSTVGALIDDATSGLALVHPPPDVVVSAGADVRRRELAIDARLAPRAVKNLVDNAVTHGGGRGVRVDVTASDGAVAIAVTDEGPGLEDAVGVFQPFTRGSSGTGVGLGLALSRAIALAHGGSLVVTPAADGHRGARLVLTLPLAYAERQ